MSLALRDLAWRLGGEACGGQVLAPGPGHGPRDRSLTVRLSPAAPDGFIVFSHAGDDWRVCRDHVRQRLGIAKPEKIEQRDWRPSAAPSPDAWRVIWRAARHPHATLMARYLGERGLALASEVAGIVLRWHPCIGAMIALFRNVQSGEPQAISRTFLDGEGRKIERKFLGPVRGAAVMLDGFDSVTHGLHIGEGIETCLAARQFGLRPCWALGSKGAIARFPVLPGVEALTVLGEPDATRELETCARRWHDAGREVFINRSLIGKDLADAWRGAA